MSKTKFKIPKDPAHRRTIIICKPHEIEEINFHSINDNKSLFLIPKSKHLDDSLFDGFDSGTGSLKELVEKCELGDVLVQSIFDPNLYFTAKKFDDKSVTQAGSELHDFFTNHLRCKKIELNLQEINSTTNEVLSDVSLEADGSNLIASAKGNVNIKTKQAEQHSCEVGVVNVAHFDDQCTSRDLLEARKWLSERDKNSGLDIIEKCDKILKNFENNRVPTVFEEKFEISTHTESFEDVIVNFQGKLKKIGIGIEVKFDATIKRNKKSTTKKVINIRVEF